MKPYENLTTVEQMEADAEKLKEVSATLNVETWQHRAKAQGTRCKFGEDGVCCRMCHMGPCRITPKAPRGVCGNDEHGIAGRHYLRTIAAGTSAHSDHARHVLDVLRHTKRDGHFQVKDEQKLINLAKEWDIPTEGRDIYDIAHDVGNTGLQEFGKVDGYMRYVKRAPEERQKLWEKLDITPRAIDREIATAMHMTHIGNSTDPEFLIRQGLRTSLANGWGGSMLGTDITDILFGTPVIRHTEGNLGVIDKEQVNIIIHGHDPIFSEMIIAASETKEVVDYCKSKGAKGINISGICCTANEVTMRHGVKIAGSYLQQEDAILTGAIEMMCVDVQCIFPSLVTLTGCFHTKFVTTSPIARIPGAIHVEIQKENALTQAIEIVKMACDNFTKRDNSRVFIPATKQPAEVGYPIEQITKKLDTITNSHVDELGSLQPAIDAIKAGVIRGAVGFAGCNNPRIRPDYSHFEMMKELLRNDVLIVCTGCAAQTAAKAGLLTHDAKEICGDGMRRVCDLLGIPPILHMGACIDNTRILRLVAGIAKQWGVNMNQLPIMGCAPEWMSEKAVSIANYFVASGVDIFLGIEPMLKGSSQMMHWITQGTRDLVGAGLTINQDPHKLVQSILETIEAKRKALGI